MWANADLKNDAWFIRAVEKGLLTVSRTGVVTSTKTGNVLGANPLAKAGGYHRVCFSHKGKSRSIYLHRLVWLVFKGKIARGYQVNHKDGNRSHNHLSNFNLKTNADNTKHGYRRLGNVRRSGVKHTLAAFDDRTVRKIRRVYATGKYSHKRIADHYGVSQKAIYNVVNNLSYRNVN